MEQNLPTDPNKKYSRYYTYVKPVISDPVISGYFGLVATMVLCAFFIIFAISPTVSTILGLKKKIDDQKQLIKTMDSKINNLIVAQENYSQIEPYLPLLNTAFPQTPLPEDLITGVVASATNSGAKISSLQIKQTNLAGQPNSTDELQATVQSKGNNVLPSLDIPTTDFSVSITGGVENVRQFARSLQTLPRLITLSTMSIGTDTTFAGSAGKDKVSADLSGSSYYLK